MKEFLNQTKKLKCDVITRAGKYAGKWAFKGPINWYNLVIGYFRKPFTLPLKM